MPSSRSSAVVGPLQHGAAGQGPRVRRHLNGEAVQQGRQPPGRGRGVLAPELTGPDALRDDLGQRRLPLLVEVTGHLAERRLAQRGRPALDPQLPPLGLPGRRVPADRGAQSADGAGTTAEQLAQLCEITLGGVRESGRDELLLGREVVEDQRVAHREGRGDIGDADGAHTPCLDLLDRGAQHLFAPFLHAQPDSCHATTLHTDHLTRPVTGGAAEPLTVRCGAGHGHLY